MSKKNQTPQQQKHAEKGRARAEFEKEVNKKVLEAARQLQAENPAYADFKVMAQNRVYIPNKAGKTKAIVQIVDGMVLDRTGKKSKADILREVQPNFPELTLHASLWYNALHPSVWKKAQDRINGNTAVHISIKGCKTLAEIYAKLKANRERNAAVRKFKKEIAISKDAVVIGKTTHAISQRKAGKHEYACIRITGADGKRAWIRVDVLMALLEE